MYFLTIRDFTESKQIKFKVAAMADAPQSDKEFRDAASAFLQGFVKSMVSILHRRRLISADIAHVTEEDINLVFEICFSAMAQIEDHGGLLAGEQTYFVHLAFATVLTDPVQLLTSKDRTILHGGLTDEVIIAALRDVLPATGGPPDA